MQTATSAFERFMKRRELAAKAFVTGNGGPVAAMATERSPATFFGPGGGHVVGAPEVVATYARDAARFAPGGDSHFEILHNGAGGEIGYWVGYQRAAARFDGSADPTPFDLRVTEIFRREDGEWRLIHRHADPLVSRREGGPAAKR